ncbi:MAG: enoyl-CoA hydratase/isomerase family protein [Actinobacteria bacterium]|nr:enoyl-CoA hydratase/isomerase family protein [Actinomycetota bacterium]
MSESQNHRSAASVIEIVETEPGIVTVTLNRPEALNALNPELIRALHSTIDDLADRGAVRAVILTGSGRAFCAGLDLAATDVGGAIGAAEPAGVAGATARPALGRPQAGMRFQRLIASLMPKLRELKVPVIAAVNGAAVGGGLALALASDIRIASNTARFGDAFVKIGLSGCDVGVSWLLPRLVGAGRAHELMLTGRIIDAEEALRIGLVTSVVEPVALLDAALDTARAIARNSPFGIEMTKEVSYAQLEIGSFRAGIDLENRTQILTSFTEDTGEAVASFFERRDPEFRNR